jgi:hypothetical protein
MGIFLFLAAATLLPINASPLAGHYQSMTETEYSIELDLKPKWRASLKFNTWEADGSVPPKQETLVGKWSQQGDKVVIQFPSGMFVKYESMNCLPYTEFGHKGCSAGLRFIESNLPVRYGLARYGLWDAKDLKIRQ